MTQKLLRVLCIDLVVKQHGGVSMAQLVGRTSEAGLLGVAAPVQQKTPPRRVAARRSFL